MLHSFVNFNPAYTFFTFTIRHCSVCVGVDLERGYGDNYSTRNRLLI